MKKIKEKSVLQILDTLRDDCDEALSGKWDKSDCGFDAMKDDIKRVKGSVKELLRALDGIFKECLIVSKFNRAQAYSTIKGDKAKDFAKLALKRAKGEIK